MLDVDIEPKSIASIPKEQVKKQLKLNLAKMSKRKILEPVKSYKVSRKSEDSIKEF